MSALLARTWKAFGFVLALIGLGGLQGDLAGWATWLAHLEDGLRTIINPAAAYWCLMVGGAALLVGRGPFYWLYQAVFSQRFLRTNPGLLRARQQVEAEKGFLDWAVEGQDALKALNKSMLAMTANIADLGKRLAVHGRRIAVARTDNDRRQRASDAAREIVRCAEGLETKVPHFRARRGNV